MAMVWRFVDWSFGYPSGNNKGRSYVVFGGPGVGKSGDLLLSSLDGTNGFKLDGEINNDYSGIPSTLLATSMAMGMMIW